MTAVLERVARAEIVPTSQEAYATVMAEVGRFSGDSPRLREMRAMGIDVVPLEPARLDLRGHIGLVSDQTELPTGSYKVRGMACALLSAREKSPDLEEVHIASAGNAAKGLAYVACRYGIRTSVECVLGVSSRKHADLLAMGASVNVVHTELEAGMTQAKEDGKAERHAEVHAFDQAEVIAGQATVGLETLADLLERERQSEGRFDLHKDKVKLFVPIGGGGLITGIACVMRRAKDEGLIGRHNVEVMGVQMTGCDAMRRYVKHIGMGETPPEDLFVKGKRFDARSDGTAVRKPGELTRAIVGDPKFVAGIMLVTPGELGLAMEDLQRTRRKRIEPAAALSTAAANKYSRKHPAVDRRYLSRKETLITFVTGASVDEALFAEFSRLAYERRQDLEARRRAEAAAYVATLAAMPKAKLPLPTLQGRAGTRVCAGPAAFM